MDYKKIPYYGLFAALAILMGYVEMMFPLPIPIPGVKLGLANVIIIIMMYFMDTKSAFFVSLVRVFLSGLLFAGFAGLLYSLSGAMLSIAVMALLKKLAHEDGKTVIVVTHDRLLAEEADRCYRIKRGKIETE